MAVALAIGVWFARRGAVAKNPLPGRYLKPAKLELCGLLNTADQQNQDRYDREPNHYIKTSIIILLVLDTEVLK